MRIRLKPFGGIIPKADPHYLPDSAAVTAQNCKFTSGSLEAWKNPLTVNTPSKVGTKTSIYLYEDQYWLHWVDLDVNVAKSPTATDAYKRIYWTGDGAPKMSVLDAIVTGGTAYPNNSYLLGVPAPAMAPTVSVVGSISDPDPTLVESRTYVYRYVSAYGEAGPPSSASVTVDVAPGQSVDITNMSVAPVGNYNIATKEIFRSNTGSSDTAYQLAGSVAVATTTFSDTVDSADLGEVLDSLLWDVPPTDLKGLIALPNGCLAGYSGNELCYSVAYQPHAWPLNQRWPVSDEIMGIGAYGMTVLVTTNGAPRIATGQDPTDVTIERLENGYACTLKLGVVDMGYAVAYPSTGGLMSAGVNGVELITRDILSKDDWQALGLTKAYFYGGLYIGFGTTTFIFNPATKDLATLSGITATAGYHDPATGELYLMVGSNIVKWDAGVGYLTYTWKSKPFVSEKPINMSCARVYADSYPVTLKVYVDGTLKHTQTVANNLVFRLPSGFRGTEISAQVEGTVNVYAVDIAESVSEMK